MLTDTYSENPQDALKEALDKAGGPLVVAGLLGISRQAVIQWSVCPPLRALEIEAASGVSRHRLRPDIYPDPDTAREAKSPERAA